MTSQKLELRVREVGPWPMNSYALICRETGRSVLIDPGADAGILVEMLSGSKPIAILLTHSHPDHIGVLAEMRELLDVPLMAHRGPHHNSLTLGVDRHLSNGEVVQLGQVSLQVFHTPGHIEDQISFLALDEFRAVVGDTIFEGGPGKTWSAAAFRQSLHTLQNVVLGWPDETICYPGHGLSFRLGDKRSAIKRFLAKDHGEFFGDATWDM